MSCKRVFLWTCDHCGSTKQREDFGFPRGWIFVMGLKITHRCPLCQTDVPPARRGTPKVVAKQ